MREEEIEKAEQNALRIIRSIMETAQRQCQPYYDLLAKIDAARPQKWFIPGPNFGNPAADFVGEPLPGSISELLARGNAQP